MNLKLAGALVAATAAVSMLAGCPQGDNAPPNTPPEEEKPVAYKADSLLAGLISAKGEPFYFENNYTPVMEAKAPGGARVATASIQVHDVTSSKKQMYYEFKDGLTAGSQYQVIWEYDGTPATKSADVSTIALFVTDPVKAEAAATKPNVLPIDIDWTVGMKPDFNASSSVPVKFEFKPITNLTAQYQIQVYARNIVDNVEKFEIRWASEWMAANNTKVDWNGQPFSDAEKTKNAQDDAGDNTPSGTALSDGTYYYLIRFRKEGQTFGGSNFYGQSQRIPFVLDRP